MIWALYPMAFNRDYTPEHYGYRLSQLKSPETAIGYRPKVAYGM